ncbi:ATP-dependent DNA ligase [Candidatus Woesearchaeota archaeon]|nr:ATP-dependent DNA ligase [Candidatus Woesearchaeota archaeon]
MKYSELADIYQKLESTSKRLEKTFHISELLKKTPVEDLPIIMLLLQGRIYPTWDERKLGVASRLVLKAINIASGINTKEIEEIWKSSGDLGLTAEQIVARKKQNTLFSQDLSLRKVFENLKKLAGLEGEGTVDRKIKLIAELLTSSKPIEAKYIARTVLDLRVGVGEGSIRDAIVWAFLYPIEYKSEENDINLTDEKRTEYNKCVDEVQEAIDITNDFSEVAVIAKQKGIEGLKNVTLEVGKPIKVMLYQKAENFEDAFERVGKPAALEYKYDGFRLQLHRNKEKIILYTRRLENVTKQFPDVVETIKSNIKSENYILDAEIIGIDPKTKKWLAFQNISQRIKRKYDIHQMTKNIPVMVNLFDAIQINNENLIKKQFSDRRNLLKQITIEFPEKLQLAKQIITDNIAEAEEFYNKALDKGNEGIMVKNLNAPYKPGSRVGYGVKVKPVMETLDLVIVGAEWGQGKRASWLSSFKIACIDENGNFLEIGKVGTGIKEKDEEGISFNQLTQTLKPLIISEKGKEVQIKPQIVLEINYEEIQKSPTYTSGFALRFPRLVKLRQDRSPEEISTLETVKEFYENQS